MNAPGQKDKFTPELRILVASLLSFGVIILWARFFGPKPQIPPTQTNRPAQTAPATPGPATSPASTPSPTTATPAKIAPATTASIAVKNDSQERSVVLDDEQLQNAANGGLYRAWVSEPGPGAETHGQDYSILPANPIKAPSGLDFVWSDGHLEVTKHFQFDHTYVVRVETSAKFNGNPIKAGLGWLGGFGDLTVTNPAPVETVTTYYSEGGKITNFPHKKLDGLDKWGPGLWQGGKDFVGIEDRYFTAAFLPPIVGRGDAVPVPMGALETRYWKASRTVKVNGQDTLEPVPQVAASTQPLALRVYVGPKDYDDLKKMNPPLHGLINFGWLEFIAEPLFHGLKWLHTYIPNWGWAIVVLTLVINMLLFPLRISSYKTTLKMQRVAPEIKAIQEKYKKYSMRDPRKAEMNKEVMAIYSREGINPDRKSTRLNSSH